MSVGCDEGRPLPPTSPVTWSITWAWSRTCGKHSAGAASLSTPRPIRAWRCTSGMAVGAQPERVSRPRALHVGTLGLPAPARPSPADHVITPEQLAWRGARADGPFFEGHHPIDNRVAYPLRFLDDAPLSSREVRGIHRAGILEAQLLLIVDDNVGGVPLLQDPPVRESGDPGWQTT